MPLTVHIYHKCPFCRPVLMLDRYLGLNLNYKEYDTLKKEHMVPEFLKLNPLHTVPTVEEEDLIIWESPIVLQYLADKFAKDDSLFPKDVKKRAKVQFRIQFFMGTLMPRFGGAYGPVIHGGATSVDPAKVKAIHEALDILENFLKKDKYAAGDSVTIADFALASVIATLQHCGANLSHYENIQRWFSLAKELKGFDKSMTVGFEEKPKILLE